MAEFSVLLIEPKHEGNVGAVARCMKNFGFDSLILINPCEIGEECYKRSKHAKDVILNAKQVDSLSEASKSIEFLVGTSGIVNVSDKHYIRNPKTPRQFVEHARDLDCHVGLLFGREDYGLYHKELMKCDMLLSIPTSEVYPIMNLSHAVAVVLYELASAELKFKMKGRHKSTKSDRDRLFEQFKRFLEEIGYPKQKCDNTQILFRRLLGRSKLSKWEFYTLMGVFDRGRGWSEKKDDGEEEE